MRWLDRPPSFGALAITLLPVTFLLLLPVDWNDNEEGFFLLAHKAIEPAAFGPFSATPDAGNYRLLSNWILGVPVVAFGYEVAHVLARVVMATLYALGLSAFFSALRLSVLDSIAVLGVFVLADENLFAGEWLFRGVESKTFAYAAVLGAFGLGLRNRWGPAMALGILAIYLHFLVGGFWILALIALSGLRDHSLSRPMRLLGLVAALVSPLVLLIALEQLGNRVVLPPGSLNPDEIYSAFRNAHHVAPFSSLWKIISWSDGLVAAAALLLTFVVAIRHARDPSLYILVSVGLLYLFVALAIAFFDRETHFFGKFYLFRPNSLLLLMAITLAATGLRDADPTASERGPILQAKQSIVPARMLLLAVISTVFIWNQIEYKTRAWLGTRERSVELAEIVAAVERESSPGEIVLLQPEQSARTMLKFALHRLLPRPTLVSFKFVPLSNQAILHWYSLIEFQRQLFAEGCRKHLPYPIKLLIVYDNEALQNVKSCGPVIWRGAAGILVRVEM